MRRLHHIAAFGFIALLAVRSAIADPKIDDETLGESGKWAGCALSPHGVHVAMLMSKGSRFIMQMDGAAGPRIDQLIGFDGNPFLLAARNVTGGLTEQIPVTFSSDGAHYAYFAKVGDEYVLIADGKEMARGKYTSSELPNPKLTVTLDGKHVIFRAPAADGYHVIVDGKPGPASHKMPDFVVSPDGAHYAYQGTQADGQDTKWAVVDGRQVKYFGDDLQFTAKGHLLAIEHGKGVMALNVDNKVAMQAANIIKTWISPHGGEIAALINPQPNAKAVLTINGTVVPGSDAGTIMNVYFSPDDKRYAALCMAVNQQFIILDGKKQQTYQAISTNPGPDLPASSPRAWATGRQQGEEIGRESNAPDCPGFTADSSKFVYVALSSGKSFLVTNDDESDGLQNTFTPVISSDGKHIAYVTSQGAGGSKPKIVLDDKTITFNGRPGPNSGGATTFNFSPDGAHYVFTCAGDMFIDGKELPNISCQGTYMYSPDSQHVLFQGNSVSDPAKFGLFLDGKLVATGQGVSNAKHPLFSPDSKHVYWIGHRPPETSTDVDNAVVWADGKPTAVHFVEIDALQPGNWEVSADDSLTFVARSGEDFKRFRITPGDDSNLTTMSLR